MHGVVGERGSLQPAEHPVHSLSTRSVANRNVDAFIRSSSADNLQYFNFFVGNTNVDHGFTYFKVDTSDY